MSGSSPLQVLEILLRNHNGPLPIQAVRAHALNGLFYAELARRDSALVDALHRSGGPMPFSLAPLFEPADGTFQGFRVGTLAVELGERVADVWGGLMVRRGEIQLGSAHMTVQDVQVSKSPRARSYAQLLEETPAAHGLRLQFDTPVRLTTFGRSGVLPIPHAVWQSYTTKWEAFAGATALPPELLFWVSRQVQATEVELQTRFGYIEKNIEWKGAVGVVEYLALTDQGDVPLSRVPDYLRAWQALAALAEYCGTGEKTTMGMGRTRRIKVFGPHQTSSS